MKATTKSGNDIEQLSLITFSDGRKIYSGLLTRSDGKQAAENWTGDGKYQMIADCDTDIDLSSIVEDEPARDKLDYFCDWVEHVNDIPDSEKARILNLVNSFCIQTEGDVR